MAASQKYNKLAGKHVLIIGGSSGIGYAVAEASLESGASVTISSSSASRVHAKVESLQKTYPSGKVAGYACDLSKPTVENDIEQLFEKSGKVDHIVVTAGDSLAMLPVQDITYEKIIAAGQVRFVAPLLIAKVGSRYLTPGPESSIVLSTGSIVEHPIPNWSIVASYASGMHGMTRNLALDLKPIRVNLVAPGPTDTELWDGLSPEAKDAWKKAHEAKVPTGKMGRSEDVAEAYLWLMKDRNVTGTIARSDSGQQVI